MRQVFQILQSLFVVSTTFALLACATANQAVAPGPIAEIPSEFSVPESVGIDVGPSGSVGAGSGISFGQLKAAASSGEFSDAINFGPDTSFEIDGLISGLLSPFNEFRISVDPAVKNFTAVRQEPGSPTFTIKVDFSDFDFDSDPEHKLDGFTGCSCPIACAPVLSVCPSEAPVSDLRRVGYRIWIQKDPVQPFKAVMAGFFDILPTLDDPDTPINEENAGKGEFRFDVTGLDEGGPSDVVLTPRFWVAAIYDQRDTADELNRSAKVFSVSDFTDETGHIPSQRTFHLTSSQLHKVDPRDKSYLEKTVKVNNQEFTEAGTFGNPDAFSSQTLYIGRFRDDADFWSGSFIQEASFNPDSTHIPATCARISTGENAMLPDICFDLNIDTSNEDVTRGQRLPPATVANVQFPTDFPPTPTF